MKMMHNCQFHLDDASPWPLTWSVGAKTFMSGMIMWFDQNNSILLMISVTILILTMIQW